MADNESGPEAGIKGAAEGIKGKLKEGVGSITGNDEMESEGKAQQDKADAQRDVAKAEAEAEKERAKADALEAEQRSHQD